MVLLLLLILILLIIFFIVLFILERKVRRLVPGVVRVGGFSPRAVRAPLADPRHPRPRPDRARWHVRALALPSHPKPDPRAALLDDRRNPAPASRHRHLGFSHHPILRPRLRGPQLKHARRALEPEGLRRELVASRGARSFAVEAQRRELAVVFAHEPDVSRSPANGLVETDPHAEVERGHERLNRPRAPSTRGTRVGTRRRPTPNLHRRADAERIRRELRRLGRPAAAAAAARALADARRRQRRTPLAPPAAAAAAAVSDRRQRERRLPRAEEEPRILRRWQPRHRLKCRSVEGVVAVGQPPLRLRNGREHLRDVAHLGPLRVGLGARRGVHGDVVRGGCDPSRHPPPRMPDGDTAGGARPSGDHARSRATTSGRWFGWMTTRVDSSEVDLRGRVSSGKGTPPSPSSPWSSASSSFALAGLARASSTSETHPAGPSMSAGFCRVWRGRGGRSVSDSGGGCGIQGLGGSENPRRQKCNNEVGRTRMHTLLSWPTAMRFSCDQATAPGYGEGVSRSTRSQGMIDPHPHPRAASSEAAVAF